MAGSCPTRAILKTAFCALVSISGDSLCALTVNPALPIEYTLDVQLIQTSLLDGSEAANVLGTAAQQFEIETAIDSIWAQAGIEINFLPTINRLADDFAFYGSNDYPDEHNLRPQYHLTQIVSTAASAGLLNPDPSVINMFFVDIAPGFPEQGRNAVSGIARINGNGVAMYVGDGMLATAQNREIIAGVVAHEIGHNLGLAHTANGLPNLMSPGGTSDQLTSDQIAEVRIDGIEFLSGIPMNADFSRDGVVTGFDLLLWRAGYAKSTLGDGNSDGVTNGFDFLLWQRQISEGELHTEGVLTVPEPDSVVQCLLCACYVLAASRPRSRHGRRAGP